MGGSIDDIRLSVLMRIEEQDSWSSLIRTDLDRVAQAYAYGRLLA